MSREHSPESERHHFQPAGRVIRHDGSVDKTGTWVVGGTYMREDESGREVEHVRLLKPRDGDQDRLQSMGVPVEEYRRWQHSPEEDLAENREHYSAREQRVFAPLDPELKTGREKTSEESIEEAMSILHTAVQRDATIKRIMEAHLGEADSEEGLLEALRSDIELRCELGRHFMEKIPTVPYLPERVERNDPNNLKNPNYPGYMAMTSHEYVAVLALSMIDGSFHTDSEEGIGRNEFGEVTFGQHRHAARQVLDSYSD